MINTDTINEWNKDKKILITNRHDNEENALVIDDYPYLLSYNKHTYFGEIAWKNKREQSELWSKKHKIRSRRK